MLKLCTSVAAILDWLIKKTHCILKTHSSASAKNSFKTFPHSFLYQICPVVASILDFRSIQKLKCCNKASKNYLCTDYRNNFSTIFIFSY